jgi:nucleolar protein 56
MAKTATHLLFESASGYALFKVKDYEEIAAKSKAVQDSMEDLHKFGKMVDLLSFAPFKNAADALTNALEISEGEGFRNLIESCHRDSVKVF